MSTPSHRECPHIDDAALYVLGSLSPAERTEYAKHLAGCQVCLAEVGELAGLPGLLVRSQDTARLVQPSTPAEPDQSGSDQPGSDQRGSEQDPVQGALAVIRRRRTRARALTSAGLVVVALVAVGGTAAVTGSFTRPATGVVAAATLPVPMQPMGGAEATAALALTARPWGTEVVMRCRYLGNDDYVSPVYVLVAMGTNGQVSELARWSAVPNQDIVLSSTTELDRKQLAGLEVRDAHGNVVLRTQHI